MENEPVRLRYERESVGIISEQEQDAEQNVRKPCCKRNKYKVLQRCKTQPNGLQ